MTVIERDITPDDLALARALIFLLSEANMNRSDEEDTDLTILNLGLQIYSDTIEGQNPKIDKQYFQHHLTKDIEQLYREIREVPFDFVPSLLAYRADQG